MKSCLIFAAASLILLASCTSHEVSRARLLEYKTDGMLNTYSGYIKRYSVYVNSVKKGNLWHLYDKSENLNIWARDTTMLKTQYNFPEFSATMVVTPTGGPTKLYTASSGRFRMLGLMEADLTGDFYFWLKNGSDSTYITEGYFRIFLEFADTTLTK